MNWAIFFDVELLVLLVAVLWFKRNADLLVQHLLEANEDLLTDLCVRSQGEEQAQYRKLREMTQKLLERQKSAWGWL